MGSLSIFTSYCLQSNKLMSFYRGLFWIVEIVIYLIVPQIVCSQTNYISLRIQMCSRKGILYTYNPVQGWDWNPKNPLRSGAVWILRVY